MILICMMLNKVTRVEIQQLLDNHTRILEVLRKMNLITVQTGENSCSVIDGIDNSNFYGRC